MQNLFVLVTGKRIFFLRQLFIFLRPSPVDSSIYRALQSVCPIVGLGPPTHMPVCLPPLTQRGGATLPCGLGGGPIQPTGKKSWPYVPSPRLSFCVGWSTNFIEPKCKCPAVQYMVSNTTQRPTPHPPPTLPHIVNSNFTYNHRGKSVNLRQCRWKHPARVHVNFIRQKRMLWPLSFLYFMASVILLLCKPTRGGPWPNLLKRHQSICRLILKIEKIDLQENFPAIICHPSRWKCMRQTELFFSGGWARSCNIPSSYCCL